LTQSAQCAKTPRVALATSPVPAACTDSRMPHRCWGKHPPEATVPKPIPKVDSPLPPSRVPVAFADISNQMMTISYRTAVPQARGTGMPCA
jgi:hypothetical protein